MHRNHLLHYQYMNFELLLLYLFFDGHLYQYIFQFQIVVNILYILKRIDYHFLMRIQSVMLHNVIYHFFHNHKFAQTILYKDYIYHIFLDLNLLLLILFF